MASYTHYSLTFPSLPKSLRPFPPKFLTLKPLSWSPITRPRSSPPSSSSTTATTSRTNVEDAKTDPEAMNIDNLHRFIDLNVGKWHGSFHVYNLEVLKRKWTFLDECVGVMEGFLKKDTACDTKQFDAHGKLMQRVSTRLSVSSYGEDDLISLIQTLYIKQPSTSTSISGDKEEPEWAEYKIKETNMFTVDKYQQIGFFPNERAFALRYQTAGMLETVLRQGVLGEDDTGEESPKNLKLPSRLPSIVCENCLYSLEKGRRARAFHIMDPKGILEMLIVFLEDRGDGLFIHPKLDSDDLQSTDRILPFLGKWKGHSITKRSGVYGATIAEAETVVLLDMDDRGQLIQDISSTSAGTDVTTHVHWTGTISDNLVTFDGGYQITILPGGMYMGCPCDIAKNVAESTSFHLEFCWLEGPGKRQRLVRTYDVEGLAVSSTHFLETKV